MSKINRLSGPAPRASPCAVTYETPKEVITEAVVHAVAARQLLNLYAFNIREMEL